VGDAAALACEPLRRGLPPGVTLPDAGEEARAADVAWLGAHGIARGDAGRAADLVPRYVRRAQAEVLRTGLATEA
jgi:hypothetical protein